MKKQVLLPPDGGYGWIIVCASAVSTFVTIPIMQNFGLLSKERFADLGFSAAESSFIINCNTAFGMLTGFFNSALLKRYGYRKIALVSAAMVTLGITMTSFCQTFTEYIISYGLITSYGLWMGYSSTSLAVNTYFKKRKGKAVSVGTTLSGLGPILTPQLVAYLLSIHTVQGVTLILAAVSSHSFICALLLHPVKWHMKKESVEMNGVPPSEKLRSLDEEKDQEVEQPMLQETKSEPRYSRSVSLGEYVDLTKEQDFVLNNAIDDYETESAAIYGIDSALGGSVLSLENFGVGRRSSQPRISQSSTISSLGSFAYNMFDDSRRATISKEPERSRRMSRKEIDMIKISEEDESSATADTQQQSCFRRYAKNFADIYDLDMLKDPVYLNIVFGLSLVLFAEVNFSTLLAFILNEFGLTTSQIGMFLSLIGTTDIIFRFLYPYITDYVKSPPRKTLMVSIAVLMMGRYDQKSTVSVPNVVIQYRL